MFLLRKKYFISKGVTHISFCWLKKNIHNSLFPSTKQKPHIRLAPPCALLRQHHSQHLLSHLLHTHTCASSVLCIFRLLQTIYFSLVQAPSYNLLPVDSIP